MRAGTETEEFLRPGTSPPNYDVIPSFSVVRINHDSFTLALACYRNLPASRMYDMMGLRGGWIGNSQRLGATVVSAMRIGKLGRKDGRNVKISFDLYRN